MARLCSMSIQLHCYENQNAVDVIITVKYVSKDTYTLNTI